MNAGRAPSVSAKAPEMLADAKGEVLRAVARGCACDS
jgi:hypothetical protein